MAMWPGREEQLLETLLACAGMRDKAHPLALSLLGRFGSLQHLFTADLETLQRNTDTTPKVAVLIHLTGRLCCIGSGKETLVLRTTEDFANYMRPYMFFRQTEVLLLLLLDKNRRPLQCRVLQEGVVDMVRVPVTELISAVHHPSVAFCVLSHNHLSGASMPSQADKRTTLKLQDIIDLAGACLLDHIIFSDEDYTSMAQLGLLRPQK